MTLILILLVLKLFILFSSAKQIKNISDTKNDNYGTQHQGKLT